MASFFTSCADCGRTFEAFSAKVRYCGTTCRVRAHRARQAASVDLLRRQTKALADGAPAEVPAALARDAARLLERA